MQHTDNPRCSSQVFFIFCEGEQRLGRSIKEKFEQYLTITHHQAIQFVRQSKYYVIIFYRKQFLHAGFYPFLFFNGSAVRAMPVSATTVLIFYMPAFFVITLINMIAKCCSTAGFYSLHHIGDMSIFIAWQIMFL